MVEFRNLPAAPPTEGHMRIVLTATRGGNVHTVEVTINMATFAGRTNRSEWATHVANQVSTMMLESLESAKPVKWRTR